MSKRYWITGVQLGLLVAMQEQQQRQKVVDGIVDKQFIGTRKENIITKITGEPLK